jgi:hypothetical protein
MMKKKSFGNQVDFFEDLFYGGKFNDLISDFVAMFD